MKRKVSLVFIVLALFISIFFINPISVMSVVYPSLKEPFYLLEKEGKQIHFQIKMEVPEDLIRNELNYQIQSSGLQGLTIIKKISPTDWDLRWLHCLNDKRDIKIRFLLVNSKTNDWIDQKIIFIPFEKVMEVYEGKNNEQKNPEDLFQRGSGNQDIPDSPWPNNPEERRSARFPFSKNNFPIIPLNSSWTYKFPKGWNKDWNNRSPSNFPKQIVIDSSLPIFKDQIIDSPGRWNYQSIYYDNHNIAVDSNNSIFLVDIFNARIRKFTEDGKFVTEWGNYGYDSGEFRRPACIASDSNNYIYVADLLNTRIQKFTEDGKFVTEWGNYGYENGEFLRPAGIAIDNNNYVYVADSYDSRIQKFTEDGEFVTKWGNYGGDPGEFLKPAGIAIDANNYVYVADSYNSRIQKFTEDGEFVAEWASYGPDLIEFSRPTGIAIDNKNFIYVVDIFSARIKKFTENGKFVKKWYTYNNEPQRTLQRRK